MPNLNSYKAVSVRSINPPFAVYLFIYLFFKLHILDSILLWYLNIIQNFRNISPVLFRVQNWGKICSFSQQEFLKKISSVFFLYAYGNQSY